ncbi:MAG: CotH kinase family protein [Eubacteriales bacterium]
MYLDNSATRPVVVYINGAYNGLYDLNEDQNGEFLETHYGINGDTVEFIRRNQTPIKGSSKDIKRVRSFAESKNLSDDAVFAEFSQWIDVDYLRTISSRRRTSATAICSTRSIGARRTTPSNGGLCFSTLTLHSRPRSGT